MALSPELIGSRQGDNKTGNVRVPHAASRQGILEHLSLSGFAQLMPQNLPHILALIQPGDVVPTVRSTVEGMSKSRANAYLFNFAKFADRVDTATDQAHVQVCDTIEEPERTAEKLRSACTSAQEQGTDVQTFQESRLILARLTGHAGPK